MIRKYYLGIDTSNYTTSVAAVDEDGRVIFDHRSPLKVEEGGRGLRQSQAVFDHVTNLPNVIKGISDIASEMGLVPGGVGVSTRPRPVEGSYMPCFLPGVSVASAIAEVNGLALCEFSHQEGHIAAALYGNDGPGEPGRPYIAYHISGGTTEILLCEGGGVREIIGGTRDISLGQLIDRTGVAMGLGFPCGKEMDRLASEWKQEGANPFCRIKTEDGMMNISGIETQVQKHISGNPEGFDKAEVSYRVLERAAQAIADSIKQVTEKTGAGAVLMMGGVSSSSVIRKLVSGDKELSGAGITIIFGRPEYCTDNAVGTALLCRQKAKGGKNETY